MLEAKSFSVHKRHVNDLVSLKPMIMIKVPGSVLVYFTRQCYSYCTRQCSIFLMAADEVYETDRLQGLATG